MTTGVKAITINVISVRLFINYKVQEKINVFIVPCTIYSHICIVMGYNRVYVEIKFSVNIIYYFTLLNPLLLKWKLTQTTCLSIFLGTFCLWSPNVWWNVEERLVKGERGRRGEGSMGLLHLSCRGKYV